MGDAVDSSAETPVGGSSAQEDNPAAADSNAATPANGAPKDPSSDVVTRSSADTTKPAVRPSGLKPPSKIGRLCAHTAPKPAVPISPRTADGSSTETLRKYSDDYSRKHLADLVEADEEIDSSGSQADRAGRYRRKASTSSTYSLTSMDALWEKHPRKLSEAGLRRSSDHSVVLTEDTDSFIIGERVWVGGSKSGQIAYIGETQFAPGDWAGIVLDDPIGKNDGSVAGTRYFQCAERRGVFSRLTRLTRAPLFSPRSPHAASPASDAGSVFTSPGAGAGAARQRRTLSPNGSVRSAVSSKMNMSVTSTANGGGGGELRLGERVIVSSSQGSKAGTLRYTGPADFAAGLWCGVELDDPIGKNDGSVEGKRYFECAPRFGLFAPASKVSRSPSNRRPGACAIHSNGRSLRRSNSRESLTSLGTSIVSSVRTASRVGVRPGVTSLASAQRTSGPRAASTPVSAKSALQELLREKQQHLERLMRERELERTEVAKVTLQVERVQAQLAHALKHSSLAVSENETLKAELLRVNKQLEDERQRAEDLLFRTEEDNIHKEDYNKFKQAAEEERGAAGKRIEALEAEVALLAATAETARAASAAAGDKHAAELDTLAAQHRDEIHAAHMLSGELQKLLDEAYALLKEKENEKESLGKSMTEELSRARAEAEKALSEAKSKLSVAQTEFEAQMSVLNTKLQMAETKLETEKQNTERLIRDNSQTITELNSKITHTQAALDDKTHELNKVTGSSKEQELTLTKEITKLKMELSAKVIDLEQLSESNKKYEVASKALESEIKNIKEDFTKKINEYESLLNETSQQNDKYSADIAELQQKLTMKTNELEKIVNESKDSSTATTKLVKEYKEIISERDKEIVKLKHDFEETTANFNKSHTIIAEEHKKLIEDRNLQIEKLTKEIAGHQQVIEKNKIDFDALTQKVDSSIDEIKNLVNQNAELSATINELNKTILELNAKMSGLQLQNGELERQLNGSIEKCSELQKAKEKVEAEYINLTSHSTNSNDEINQLSQYLRETEKELQDMRDKFREKSINLERTEQHLTKCQQDFANEKEGLNKTIIKTQDELTCSEGKVKELDDQITILKDQSSKHEHGHLTLLKETNVLEKEIEVMQMKQLELQTQLQDMNKKSEKTIEDFKHKIDILKADGETSEVKLKEKVDQLVEAQNDLNNRLEQAQENEEFLQKKLEEVSDQFNNEKSMLNKELNKKELELSVIREEISRSASEGDQVNASLEEKDNIIKNLNLKLAMLEVDIKSNMDIISEKERQVTVSAQELSKILEDKQGLEQKLNLALSELNTLQTKQDGLITEKNDHEIIMKAQQEQIEKFNKDIDVLSKEKGLIETKSQEGLEQFAKISVQYQETLKEMENIKQIKTELSNVTQEKDDLIKIETEKYFKAVANIQALQNEKDNLEKELTDKNVYIDEKEKQISKLQENIYIGNAESVAQIDILKKDMENMTKAHKGEVENLHKTIKSLETNSKENESKLENLTKKDEEIAELQNLLSKTEADIKLLTNINDGQKANYEDLNKQLQLEYDKLKKDSKKERHSLRERLQEAEKTLEDSKTKINSEVTKQTNLQSKLAESEKHAQELADKVELLTVHQKNTNNEQDNLLEKLTLELQAVRKSSTETSSSHEQLVNKLKTDVENKINDLLKKDDRITKLEEELKNQKVKTEIAQREKYLIQQESAAKEKENIRKENYDNGHSKGQGDENTLKQEERELVEGQVEFLNSVIVDMQRKNELLLARVQALETGFSPDAPAPNLFHYEGKKEVAPRLFCDICDVFDAHDTEDCPRQAGDQQSSAGAARKPPPPPRPYCDICEVFGHSTENCDEEETF